MAARPAEFFAITAIGLFALGFLSQKVAVLGSHGLSFATRNVEYAISAQTCAFGFAAAFGFFAFAYSLWMIPASRATTLWHFWLSVVSVVLFFVGLVVFRSLTATGISAMGTTSSAALVAALVACPLFICVQVVFGVAFLLNAMKPARTF
jgi:hypothetical protein